MMISEIILLKTCTDQQKPGISTPSKQQNKLPVVAVVATATGAANQYQVRHHATRTRGG